MPEPCPRCGDTDGACYGAYGATVPQDQILAVCTSVLACRLGVIGRELKRLNDFIQQDKDGDE